MDVTLKLKQAQVTACFGALKSMGKVKGFEAMKMWRRIAENLTKNCTAEVDMINPDGTPVLDDNGVQRRIPWAKESSELVLNEDQFDMLLQATRNWAKAGPPGEMVDTVLSLYEEVLEPMDKELIEKQKAEAPKPK